MLIGITGHMTLREISWDWTKAVLAGLLGEINGINK